MFDGGEQPCERSQSCYVGWYFVDRRVQAQQVNERTEEESVSDQLAVPSTMQLWLKWRTCLLSDQIIDRFLIWKPGKLCTQAG